MTHSNDSYYVPALHVIFGTSILLNSLPLSVCQILTSPLPPVAKSALVLRGKTMSFTALPWHVLRRSGEISAKLSKEYFFETFYGFRISYQCLFCRRCFHLFHNIFDVRYRGLRWIQCYRVAHRRQVFFFPMMLNPLLPFLLCQIQPKVFLKIDFNLGTINIFGKYFRVILTDTSLFCLPFISRTVSTPRLNLFFFGP